jgi:hypothetical protein
LVEWISEREGRVWEDFMLLKGMKFAWIGEGVGRSREVLEVWDWDDTISSNLLHIGAALFAREIQGRRLPVMYIVASIGRGEILQVGRSNSIKPGARSKRDGEE